MKNLEYYLNLPYEIKLRKLAEDEGGGWLATIPDLPGCMSDGKNPEEALVNIEDAKKCWVETCLEIGHPVPEPITNEYSGQLRIRIPKSQAHSVERVDEILHVHFRSSAACHAPLPDRGDGAYPLPNRNIDQLQENRYD